MNRGTGTEGIWGDPFVSKTFEESSSDVPEAAVETDHCFAVLVGDPPQKAAIPASFVVRPDGEVMGSRIGKITAEQFVYFLIRNGLN